MSHETVVASLRIKLQTRIYVIVGAVLLLGIALSTHVYRNGQSVLEISKPLLSQQLPALQLISHLQLEVAAQEPILYEYYATFERDTFRRRFNENEAHVKHDVERLADGLVSENDLRPVRLYSDKINKLAEDLDNTLGVYGESPVDWDRAREILVEVSAAGRQVNAQLDTLAASIRDSVSTGGKHAQQRVETVITAVLAFTLLSAVIAVFVGYLLSAYFKAAKERHKLAMFVEKNPNPVVRLTPSGEVVYANPGALELVSDLKLGEAGIEQVLPEDMTNRLRVLLHSDKVADRFEYTCHGRTIDCTVRYLPEHEIFHCYLSDVTEREAAEQKAVRLSKILDDSSNEIYFFDSKTLRFIQVNRGALENLGYTASELKSMTPLDLMPQHTEESFSNLVEPLRNGSKNVLLFETPHRRRDGTEYQAQIHLQLSSVTEQPTFVAIVTDISDRKNLENQLLQAQKMEAVGQLAAGIAHEINTPAQFVGDNIQFIREAFGDLLELTRCSDDLFTAVKNDSVTQELLDKVEAAEKKADPQYLSEEIPLAIEQSMEGMSRISKIVRAMKEFSHPGGNQQELTDLNKAISNTVTVASNEWKYVANVETELATDLPQILCFQQEINQVFLNLIVNAAHAIDEARDEESSEKGVIKISTRAVGDEVEISVSDTGCGMPDDVKDRIFDPFFTTKEVGKGTGQGLTMAYKSIVKKHSGKLRVESAPGAGTTFTISLPIAGNETHKVEEAA